MIRSICSSSCRSLRIPFLSSKCLQSYNPLNENQYNILEIREDKMNGKCYNRFGYDETEVYAVIVMVRPEQGKRISKIDTYLNCAEVFAYRSTCIKRKYGAVIVKDDVVISTGYNGAPRGFENCCDLGECPRIERDMHQGDGYGICRAIHAEANALLNCSRQQTIGADLYLVGVNPEDNSIHRAKPCPLCARTIIQAGINNVYLRVGENADEYVVIPAMELEWVQKI